MEEFTGLRSRVVRIGRTVRRAAHQNTPAVKALLSHLEETGFSAAPRWLGFDEEGRETLSYITGTAGHYPLKPFVTSESTLTQLGLLLRRFHDATISFSLPENVVWHNPIAAKKEVICHGDAGPTISSSETTNRSH